MWQQFLAEGRQHPHSVHVTMRVSPPHPCRAQPHDTAELARSGYLREFADPVVIAPLVHHEQPVRR